MGKTKYTFLLPAYKATYFEEALLSIKNQTYKDFKVLVSDDCSPEELEPIFNRTVGDDPRFTFRRNQENMGSKSLVSHWNLLVDMCDTEYLMMAGDDDVYDVRFLEEMDKLAVKYLEVDLFRSKVRRITAQGEPFLEDPPVNEYDTHADFLYQTYNCPRLQCIANFMFKTEPLKRKGKFMDFPLAWFSDDATTMICAENGVCNTSDILFNFRDSGINISNDAITDHKGALKKVNATKLFYNWCCIYFNKHRSHLTKIDKVKWESIERGVYERVKIVLICNYLKLSYSDFKKLLLWMDSNRFFKRKKDRFSFIIDWLKESLF